MLGPLRDLFSVGFGVLRQAADRAFAPGQWSALPTASVNFRGALARTEGGAAVSDRLHWAKKTAADVYEWTPLVNATGDTMTGPLVITSTSRPSLLLQDTDAAADEKFWRIVNNVDASFAVQAMTDTQGATPAGASSANAMSFTRTTTTPSAPTFSGLAGTGTRVVEASSVGLLSASALLGTTLVGTAAPSGASTSSINSCFTSAYVAYLVVARLSLSASNAGLSVRLRAAGADSSSALYYQFVLAGNSGGGGASAGIATVTGTSWPLLSAPGVGVTWTDVHVPLLVSGPQLTNETLFSVTMDARLDTVNYSSVHGGGGYEATTSYDGITFLPTSGNITGTIRVYGLRDS